MPTPEGRVKDRVKRLLKKYDECYYFMPVQSGFGSPSLDILVCYKGYFMAIETKAGRGKVTPRQENTIAEMEAAGAKVFVVDDTPETLAGLKKWMDNMEAYTSLNDTSG